MPQALSFSQVSNFNFPQFQAAIQMRNARISPTNIRRAWNIMVAASEFSVWGESEMLRDITTGGNLCQTVSATVLHARFLQRAEITDASLASTLSQVRKVFALITHWSDGRAIPTTERKSYCVIKPSGGAIKLRNFPVFSFHTNERVDGLHWSNAALGRASATETTTYANTAALSYVRRGTGVTTRQTPGPRLARGMRSRRGLRLRNNVPGYAAPIAASANVVRIAKPKFFDNPFMGMSAMAVFALQAEA